MQASSQLSLALAILARELGQPNLTIEDVRCAVASKAAAGAASEASNGASQDDVTRLDVAGIWKGRAKPRKRGTAGVRTCLLAKQVLEIYAQRPTMTLGRMRRNSMLHCKTLAPKYNVTAKTIREIWRGVSWAETTLPMWTQEEISERLKEADTGDEDDEDDDVLASPIDPPAAHEPANSSTFSPTSPKPNPTDAPACASSAFATTANSAAERSYANMVHMACLLADPALAMHNLTPADFASSNTPFPSANLPYPANAHLPDIPYTSASNAPCSHVPARGSWLLESPSCAPGNAPGSSMAAPAPADPRDLQRVRSTDPNPALHHQSFHGSLRAIHEPAFVGFPPRPESFQLAQLFPLLATSHDGFHGPPNVVALRNNLGFASSQISSQPNNLIAASQPLCSSGVSQPPHRGFASPRHHPLLAPNNLAFASSHRQPFNPPTPAPHPHIPSSHHPQPNTLIPASRPPPTHGGVAAAQPSLHSDPGFPRAGPLPHGGHFHTAGPESLHGVALPPGFLAAYMASSGAAFNSGFGSPNL
ncbi:hypothetical protein T484DRAFT_1933769 [Baffinella frigidus]|nr:hypothetical protein T484DRAFT_1933769 [Cryptophyta sp. CCMP2293]